MKTAQEMRQLTKRNQEIQEIKKAKAMVMIQNMDKEKLEKQIQQLEKAIIERANEGYDFIHYAIKTKDPYFPIGGVIETLSYSGYTYTLNYKNDVYMMTINW